MNLSIHNQLQNIIDTLCCRKHTFITNAIKDVNEHNGFTPITTPNYNKIINIINENSNIYDILNTKAFSGIVWGYIQATIKNPNINPLSNSIKDEQFILAIHKLCSIFPTNHPFWEFNPKNHIGSKDTESWFFETDNIGDNLIQTWLEPTPERLVNKDYIELIDMIETKNPKITSKILDIQISEEDEKTFKNIYYKYKKSEFFKELKYACSLREEKKAEGCIIFLKKLDNKNHELIKHFTKLSKNLHISRNIIACITHSIVANKTQSNLLSKITKMKLDNNSAVSLHNSQTFSTF